MKLRTLKPAHIQKLYGDLLGEQRAPASIVNLHRILREALEMAVDWDILAKNPTRGVRLPKIEVEEPAVLDATRLRLVFQASEGTRWHALWVLLATSGMRVGEALGLHWADIDAGTLHVRYTLSWRPASEGGLFLGPPKTPGSKRTIYLSGLALDALRQHETIQKRERLAAESWADTTLVFPNHTGALMRESNVGQAWAVQLRDLSLPHVKVHSLRHGAVTLLLEGGATYQEVGALVGHTALDMMDRYGHVTPAMRRAVAGRMDDLLRGAK